MISINFTNTASKVALDKSHSHKGHLGRLILIFNAQIVKTLTFGQIQISYSGIFTKWVGKSKKIVASYPLKTDQPYSKEYES